MTEVLSPAQTAALFDILTHYDTYAQIREFRKPGSLAHYGPPFKVKAGHPSSAPSLQTLVFRFILTLPGLKNLPEKWWRVQCHDIIDSLERANLSESYDKGVIGSRKTLATAISALIEYPVRGVYGGVPMIKEHGSDYDVTDAGDLGRAFRDFLNDAIYGNLLEELVQKTAETSNLEDHGQLIKAVHEFVLVNLASLMHYTLILSPKGQYLLKLIENANKLVPYMVLKQTLKIGNVASMINAVVKIGLAKMSVASVTNWIGLTQKQDEGMNLMQTIISTVLNWDIKELESRAAKLERERAQLGKDQLRMLKEYTHKPQSEQDRIRKHSQTQSISIVTAILRDSRTESELTDTHHRQAQEYLAIHLSIRDRKQLIQCLCKATPDHLTVSVREVIDAYEPVIRRMHKAVDLSATLSDFEYFVKDLIKLSKIHTDKQTGKSIVPTVGDFVQLLRKHQRASHVFLHQCCKNDKELTGWYLDWAKQAAEQFKQEEETNPNSQQQHDTARGGAGAAGKLTQPLQQLFVSLDQETQSRILPVLETHSAFLDEMHAQSQARLAEVLKSPPSKNPAIAKIFATSNGNGKSSSRPNTPRPPSSRAPSPPPDQNDTDDINEDNDNSENSSPIPTVSSSPGPGAFLARWQSLLDATPITPVTQTGPPKAASSPEVVQASATDVDGRKLVDFDTTTMATTTTRDTTADTTTADTSTKTDTDTSDVQIGLGPREQQKQLRLVIDALGSSFRKLLAERGCYW
ncbi:hypothetical protein ABEF93_006679 [Exophiala dermatitidis]